MSASESIVSRTNGWSRAFGGGLLWGERLVRFVFMDEAGTSAHEPVTVVVGLIADADKHVLSAEALALEAIGAIPPQFADGFVFHAMQVFGDKRYHEEWSLQDRLILLQNMMAIPRKIGLGLVISTHWRGSVDYSGREIRKLGLKPHQEDHLIAFSQCVCVADRSIRWYGGASEVASIVAEDVPEMRRFLRKVPELWRKNPINLLPQNLRQTPADLEAGYSTQSGEMRVTRIRNSVHFVEKADDPLVQVADACAYGLRRYFAGEKFGPEFARAILGDETRLRNFATPGGAECYWPV